MIDPPPVTERRGFRFAGIAIAVIVVALLVAGGTILIAKRSGTRLALPGAGATTSALLLRRGIELRVGAAPDTDIVAHLSAGSGVRVLGRSVDGVWLAVALSGAPDVVGWVPADAVERVRDAGRLPVTTDVAALASTSAGATAAPVLPDLRVESASSKNNRLVAVIVNDGPGDLPTPLMVSVNDGAPVRIEFAGVLHAKERIDAPVPGEYVQLRARISVRVLTEPAGREANTANNTWSGIVEPDIGNNLAIAKAVADGVDRHLVVTVRNDSPIPVRGTIMLTVREALPSTTLLGRDAREVGLEAGQTMDIPFPDIRAVDLARVAVRLSSDAIHDAVLADDSFPR